MAIIAEKIEQTILKRKVLPEKEKKLRFITSNVDTKTITPHIVNFSIPVPRNQPS